MQLSNIRQTNSKLLSYMRIYSMSNHYSVITRPVLHPRSVSWAIPVEIQAMIVRGDEKTEGQLIAF